MYVRVTAGWSGSEQLRFSGCRYLDLLDLRTIDYRLLQRGPQPALGDTMVVPMVVRSRGPIPIAAVIVAGRSPKAPAPSGATMAEHARRWTELENKYSPQREVVRQSIADAAGSFDDQIVGYKLCRRVTSDWLN